MFNRNKNEGEESNHEVMFVHNTPDKFMVEAEITVVDQDMPIFVPLIVDATSINHLTHILNQNGVVYTVQPMDE